MATRLSSFFEQQRLAKDLKPGQLAQLLGCTNLSKNGSRIRVFEQTGSISKELFEKLARYFEVDSEIIDGLVELDQNEFFQQWLAWANEPIQPYLVLRLIAAIYTRRVLSPDIETVEDAEAWAAAVARETRLRCCLVWSRKLSIWSDKMGNISERTEAVPNKPNVPWMGRSHQKFILNEDLSSTSRVQWPQKPEV